jgi:hypothetical protein
VPRYFFHIRNGNQFEPDEYGVELSGTEAVREEALITVGRMLQDATLAGRDTFAWTFEVVDEAGAPVLYVSCKIVIEDVPR